MKMIVGFPFEILALSFEMHICAAKTQKERVHVRKCLCHMTPYFPARSCAHLG